MDLRAYRQSWIRFITVRCPPWFPREMFLNRVVVESLEEYVSILERFQGPMFVALYSRPQIDRGVVDTLFLEIDGSKPPYIEDVNRKLERVLRQLGEGRVYWSGNRSAHVYLDLPPVQLKHPSLTIRQFLRPVRDCLDPTTVGDVRRVVRIPYTVHPKTRALSCRTSYPISLERILSPVEDSGETVRRDDIAEKLLSIDSIVRERPRSTMKTEAKVSCFPPCIVKTIADLADRGEASHMCRVHLTAFLLMSGFTEQDIHPLFTGAEDYDPRRTEYQISSIERAGMGCYSCQRMVEAGECPLSDPEQCPFYPRASLFIEQDRRIQ